MEPLYSTWIVLWLKNVYINPSSNACDIGKAMDNQGLVRKSTFDQ
jgi:hypothetical protein